MTVQETHELQELKTAVLTLTGEVKTLNEKVECLLDGKVANCARHDERLSTLEREMGEQKKRSCVPWLTFVLITSGMGAIIGVLATLVLNHITG